MVSPKSLYERFRRAVEDDVEEQVVELLQTLREEAPTSPERSWAEIGWCYFQDDEPGAEAGLRAHLERWPNDADALYNLGALLMARGDTKEGTALWLRVRALDTESDREAQIGREDDELFVVDVVKQTLEELPEEFQRQLGSVPVIVEARPSEALVKNGFDPRAYGLFEGPNQRDTGSIDAPSELTRIVIFLANLAAEDFDDDELADEVEITVLHEIGHYFGLDEDDMERLGLD